MKFSTDQEKIVEMWMQCQNCIEGDNEEEVNGIKTKSYKKELHEAQMRDHTCRGLINYFTRTVTRKRKSK
jgi:hypothetical protein